jgi:poly(3-hydroxybutyrate) depolymerase
MTYAAGCELADRVLAIAPVSGGTRELPPAIPRARSRSSTTTGTRIRSSPTAVAATTTTAGYATSWPTGPPRGLPSAPRARRIDPHVTRLDWPACRGGVRVAHLRIERRPARLAAARRPPGIGIDGAEEIWRFFAGAGPRDRAIPQPRPDMGSDITSA